MPNNSYSIFIEINYYDVYVDSTANEISKHIQKVYCIFLGFKIFYLNKEIMWYFST